MAEEEHVVYAVEEAVAEVCEPQTAISTVLGLGPSAIIGSSPAPSYSNGPQTAVRAGIAKGFGPRVIREAASHPAHRPIRPLDDQTYVSFEYFHIPAFLGRI